MRAELTVLEGGLERASRPRPGVAALLFVALAGAAGVATLLGADRARAPFDAIALGARGERAAAAAGAEAPEVRVVLRELRARLGARPLDAASRLAYAGVLREAAAGPQGIAAAVFHAERGAATAPVTAGFVGTAARILARSGRPDRAAQLVRGMFSWSPNAAAGLLREVEPFLGAQGAGRVVPRDPHARRAWIVTLRNGGRNDEARVALDEALRDDPGDAAIVELAAWAAIAAGDHARVAVLIPDDAPVPAGRAGAGMLTLRALSKARRGDAAGARADARAAAETAPDDSGVLTNAGDALQAAGDLDGARDFWQRARFELAPGAASQRARLNLSLRLARVEERAGRPGEALRAWSEVLEQDPENAEALRRRDVLRGVR